MLHLTNCKIKLTYSGKGREDILDWILRVFDKANQI